MLLSRSSVRFVFAVLVPCFVVSAAWSDSLRLSNGSVINGKFLGGSETEVTFRVGSTVQHYSLSDITSISFDNDSRAAATDDDSRGLGPDDTPHLTPHRSAAAATPRLAPVSNAGMLTIPSGTRLTVRTIDAIDSDRNQIGDKFQATLEQPIVIDGVTIVDKGADVYGRLAEAKSAGQIQGRSELKLELTGLVVNGQTIPVVTGDYAVSGSSRGESTAKRVGGGAALGAIIGAIAGGGKGAAIGAGVGAGAGTAVQVMTKGEQVHVPSETLLDFSLQQDVSVPATNSARD